MTARDVRAVIAVTTLIVAAVAMIAALFPKGERIKCTLQFFGLLAAIIVSIGLTIVGAVMLIRLLTWFIG